MEALILFLSIECNVNEKNLWTNSMLTLTLQLARLVFQMSQFQSIAGHMTAVEPLLKRALDLEVGDTLFVNI